MVMMMVMMMMLKSLPVIVANVLFVAEVNLWDIILDQGIHSEVLGDLEDFLSLP